MTTYRRVAIETVEAAPIPARLEITVKDESIYRAHSYRDQVYREGDWVVIDGNQLRFLTNDEFWEEFSA